MQTDSMPRHRSARSGWRFQAGAPLFRAIQHTTSTAPRKAGVPRDEVESLARHRDAPTTETYYLGGDGRRRRARSALEEPEERGRAPGTVRIGGALWLQP